MPPLPDLVTPLTGRPISPVFGLLLICHIAGGLTSVVAGVGAMASRKRRGRHPRFGTVYYAALGVVSATAAGMAALRWPENAYLLVLGCLAFGAASVGYAARKLRWRGWLGHHILGMGASYIVLLTAFYVDNGPHLPLWNRLPAEAFWIGPSALGLPLLALALRRHTGARGNAPATA